MEFKIPVHLEDLELDRDDRWGIANTLDVSDDKDVIEKELQGIGSITHTFLSSQSFFNQMY